MVGDGDGDVALVATRAALRSNMVGDDHSHVAVAVAVADQVNDHVNVNVAPQFPDKL